MSILWSSSSFKSMVFLHFIKCVFHSYQMGKGNIQEFTKMLHIVILLWSKCFTVQKMYCTFTCIKKKMYCLSTKASLPTVFSLFLLFFLLQLFLFKTKISQLKSFPTLSYYPSSTKILRTAIGQRSAADTSIWSNT